MSYLYGYVWRDRGRIIKEEREHVSRSAHLAVVSAEIMQRRLLLKVPQSATPTILWKQRRKSNE